jgi:hypothetical protein
MSYSTRSCAALFACLALSFGITLLAQDDAAKQGDAVQSVTEANAKFEARVGTALQSKIDVDFKDATLTTVAEFFENALGVNVYFNRRALNEVAVDPATTPVTLNVKGISAQSALRLVLAPHDLTWTVENEVLAITTPDAVNQELVTRVYPVGDLEETDHSQETSAPARDRLDSLIELMQTTIQPQSWDDVGGPGNMDALQQNLVVTQTIEVHEEIQDLLAAIRRVRKALDSNDWKTAYPAYPSSTGPQYEALEAALLKRVSLKLDRVSLVELAADLTNNYGVSTVLNARALDDIGLDPSKTLVSLKAKEITLRSALRLMLSEHDLTWVLQDEVLQITTPDTSNQDLQSVLYPVPDLARAVEDSGAVAEPLETSRASDGAQRFTPMKTGLLAQFGGVPQQASVLAVEVGVDRTQLDYDSVIETITTTIEPQSWDEVGGPGSIAPIEPITSLVISQTQEVHVKIAELLIKLRSSRQQQADAPGRTPQPREAAEAPRLVIYHVSGSPQPSVHELAKVVRELIEPDSWKDSQTVYIGALNRSIVVRHRAAVHQQIRQLLEHLIEVHPRQGGSFGPMRFHGAPDAPPAGAAPGDAHNASRN